MPKAESRPERIEKAARRVLTVWGLYETSPSVSNLDAVRDALIGLERAMREGN